MDLFERSTAEFRRTAELTEEEKETVGCYQGDSTFFHAIAQGWAPELHGNDKFKDAVANYPQRGPALERAISKYEVTKAGRVWSAHANGTAILGSIRGDYGKLVGMHYRYGGFISCSNMKLGADGFLDSKPAFTPQPVMLTIQLRVGMHALPMHDVTTNVGEGEILLGRKLNFEIVGAEEKADARFKEPVVWLSLRAL